MYRVDLPHRESQDTLVSANGKKPLYLPLSRRDSEQPLRYDSTEMHPMGTPDGYSSPRTPQLMKEPPRKRQLQQPGTIRSLLAILRCSSLNVLLVFIPLSWIFYFVHPLGGMNNIVFTFAFSFVSLVGLSRLFEYGGEQAAYYCGRTTGDLLVISLNNLIEGTLALILLAECQLRILQSTLIGVVLLRLLLVSGTTFLIDGTQVWEQHINSHTTQINHSLLTIGVFTLVIPYTFFSALAPNSLAAAATSGSSSSTTATAHRRAETSSEVTGFNAEHVLAISRGIAIIMLLVYLASRIYLARSPANKLPNQLAADAPVELLEEERRHKNSDPEVNLGVCIVFVAVTTGLMTLTSLFLVKSIEELHSTIGVSEEWFGLILLPIISFAADAAVAVIFFVKKLFKRTPAPPSLLAKVRAMDLSIQFILFWVPFIVLVGWWTKKPMSLLFDVFEVSITITACFLVNYITADSKTNWLEGLMMISFYVMIALTAWFYTGQPSIGEILATGACTAKEITETGSHEAVATATSSAIQHAAETTAAVTEHAAKLLRRTFIQS